MKLVTVSQRQVELINAACGLDWTIEDMMRCGERAWNLKRVNNNRMRLTSENDRLPKAFLELFAEVAPQDLYLISRECCKTIMKHAAGIVKLADRHRRS